MLGAKVRYLRQIKVTFAAGKWSLCVVLHAQQNSWGKEFIQNQIYFLPPWVLICKTDPSSLHHTSFMANIHGDTFLLSQCLALSRSINGYRRIVPCDGLASQSGGSAATLLATTWVFRAIFSWVIGFALQRYTIRLTNSHHFFIQSDVSPKLTSSFDWFNGCLWLASG